MKSTRQANRANITNDARWTWREREEKWKKEKNRPKAKQTNNKRSQLILEMHGGNPELVVIKI